MNIKLDKSWDKPDIQLVLLKDAIALCISILESASGYRFNQTLLVTKEYTDQSPRINYERGPNGEYHIFIYCDDSQLGRCCYQVAHELCHILCNYSPKFHLFKWFEETLCEVASLYCLTKMRNLWFVQQRDPIIKRYAVQYTWYLEETTSHICRFIPSEFSLAEWVDHNIAKLSSNPKIRQLNGSIADQILPFVIQKHDIFSAARYLNTWDGYPVKDLHSYFNIWNRTVISNKQKSAVAKLAKLFDIDVSL